MPREGMTPRERWLAVLRRERPDRVPMDYWATGEANQKLMRHLGCATMQAVLRGEVPDKIPFTIYESKLPRFLTLKTGWTTCGAPITRPSETSSQ
jgi:hypothetical protein